MSEDVEKLRKEVMGLLDGIAKQVSSELIQIKAQNYSQTVRLEALLRSLFSGNSLVNYTLDSFLDSVDNIVEWKKEIQKIQAIPEIVKRVEAALVINEKLNFKIYADDLNFVTQIENAGGTRE